MRTVCDWFISDEMRRSSPSSFIVKVSSLLLVGSFMFSSVWFSLDYTRTASEFAENRGGIPTLRDASLRAQEPSPMVGAAEGVWLDSESIHPSPPTVRSAELFSESGHLPEASYRESRFI